MKIDQRTKPREILTKWRVKKSILGASSLRLDLMEYIYGGSNRFLPRVEMA